MTLSWPNHLLTLEEWEALPEDTALRLELAEGMLVLSPMPLSLHQRAVMRLGYRVDEQLQPDLTALSEVEIVVFDPPLTIGCRTSSRPAPMSSTPTRPASAPPTSCSRSRCSPTAPAASTAC